MNSNGDYPSIYSGVGLETAPSQSFGNEPTTGVFLESPGTSSSYSISKRGTKRLRITDTKTEIIGPLEADGFTPSGPTLLPDGSQSAPSLAYSSSPSTGLWYDSKNGFLNTSVGGVATFYTADDQSGSYIPFAAPYLGSDPGGPTHAAYSSADQKTGWYFPSQFEAGVTTNGSSQVVFSQTGSTFTNVVSSGSRFSTADGAVGAPSLTFNSDLKTGISHDTLNHLVNTQIDGKIIHSVSSLGLDVVGTVSTNDILDSKLTPSKLVESSTDSHLISSTVSSSDLLPKNSLFGDGSDGNVTISVDTTLTRDMFYDTLTINSGARLMPVKYRIYCKTQVTGDGTGIISFNGNNGIVQTPGTITMAAGAGEFGGNSPGGTGGAINNNGLTTAVGGGQSGRGGRGGDSVTSTKTGGTQPPVSTSFPNDQFFKNPFYGPTNNQIGGSGGTGGAGSLGAPGGGGGAGGGRICLVTRAIGNISSIEAKGGNGGPGGDVDAGAGAGGGGGFVYIITSSLGTFNPATQINVTYGSPGATGSLTNSVPASAGSYTVVLI